MSAVGRIKINSIYVLVAIMTIAILLYTRSFVHPYRIASLYLHDGERHGGEEEGRGRAAADDNLSLLTCTNKKVRPPSDQSLLSL